MYNINPNMATISIISRHINIPIEYSPNPCGTVLIFPVQMLVKIVLVKCVVLLMHSVVICNVCSPFILFVYEFINTIWAEVFVFNCCPVFRKKSIWCEKAILSCFNFLFPPTFIAYYFVYSHII